MPKYEFECPNGCGSTIVEAETGSDVDELICPECGESLMRVWFTKFHLKGEGWTRRPNDEIPTMDLPPVSASQRSR